MGPLLDRRVQPNTRSDPLLGGHPPTPASPARRPAPPTSSGASWRVPIRFVRQLAPLDGRQEGAAGGRETGGGGGPLDQRRALAVERLLAFWMAWTSSCLLIVDRPRTSRRRATSMRCALLALASTPPAVFPPPRRGGPPGLGARPGGGALWPLLPPWA